MEILEIQCMPVTNGLVQRKSRRLYSEMVMPGNTVMVLMILACVKSLLYAETCLIQQPVSQAYSPVTMGN